MDVSDEEVTSVLTEALSNYLKIIELEQRLHESSLPRQGKSAESGVDVARTQHYQSRVLVTETCLRFAARIAPQVRRLVVFPEESKTSNPSHDQIGNVSDFRPTGLSTYDPVYKDDEPFINPMSGRMIQPITSRSAGPSNTYDPGGRNPSAYKVEVPPLPTSITDAKQDKNSENSKATDSRNYDNFSNLEFGNTSESSETSEDIALATPASSTSPSVHEQTNYSPNNGITHFEDDRTFALRLQAEWAAEGDLLERDLDPEFDMQTVNSTTQFDLDLVEARRLQAQLDNEQQIEFDRLKRGFELENARLNQQAKYAQELEESEQKRSAERAHTLVEAQRVARKLQAEDATIAEQAGFAKDLHREEEVRNEMIDRDVAAARAAQAQWEEEALQLEEQARRAAEELERREAEERRRQAAEAAEAERRSRLERERRAREEEQQRERERQEAERRARQADCVSCMETGEKADMCLLPCNHAYCGECINAAFNAASNSRQVFKCCGNNVPTTVAARFLSTPFIATYENLLLELNTTNPRYCSLRTCGQFIPPSQIHGTVAICSSCGTRTCVSCREVEHAGVCAEDKDGKAVLALAQRKGWKTCPRCNITCEKTEGCLHMTCRCGAEWCYSCLADWSICESRCSRS